MALIAYHHQGSDTKAHCTLDTFVACFSLSFLILFFLFLICFGDFFDCFDLFSVSLFFIVFPFFLLGESGLGDASVSLGRDTKVFEFVKLTLPPYKS